MEDGKVREAEIMEEMKALVAEKFEVFNKLEGLAGLPEKLVKQVIPRMKCFFGFWHGALS